MDIDQYFRFVMALAFVLVLIVGVAWGFRRLGFGNAAPSQARNRRVSVVEVTALDTKRRLVLVRRDDVEHLILLSASGDRVIESGIRAGREPAAPREPTFRDTIAAVEKAEP